MSTTLNHNLDCSEDHRLRGRTSSKGFSIHTLDKRFMNQLLLKPLRVKRPLLTVMLIRSSVHIRNSQTKGINSLVLPIFRTGHRIRF